MGATVEEKFANGWNSVKDWVSERFEDSAGDKLKAQQQAQAGAFADRSQSNFESLGPVAYDARELLRKRAMGERSITAEQLRQGLQQNLAGQRSMQASADPRSQQMAARTAAIQSARLGAGMSGQAATARMQEQQLAEKAWLESIAQQQGLMLQGALGSRGAAVGGQDKGWLEKYGPAIASVAGMVASDRRVKEDVKDADKDANKIIAGLKAYRFRYSDEGKHGKGEQVGVMAQDLERGGLKHAVFDMPDGTKAVHGAKLATANTAMLAALGKRVLKLEGKGK